LAAVVLAAAMAVPVMRNAAAIIDASNFFNVVPSFLRRLGAVDSPQQGAALLRGGYAILPCPPNCAKSPDAGFAAFPRKSA
jgi:hypothetical protein